MLPMLAHRYSPSKISYPVYIQPKLNGVRMLSYDSRFQSRDQHFWDPNVLPHLLTQLRGSSFAFDGELFRMGMSLQEINSRVAVNRLAAHDKIHSIQYHIFDMVSAATFHQRAMAMKELKRRELFDPLIIHFVDTYLVHSQNEADYYYAQFKEKNYEGMMYRDPSAGYGFVEDCGNKENRWNRLLKRKEMLDDIATIIGVNEGEGQFCNAVGSFELQLPSGAVFNAGSGLTIEQRNTYWRCQNDLLGIKVAFRYEMLSDGGIPLKPIIDVVHHYPI